MKSLEERHSSLKVTKPGNQREGERENGEQRRPGGHTTISAAVSTVVESVMAVSGGGRGTESDGRRTRSQHGRHRGGTIHRHYRSQEALSLPLLSALGFLRVSWLRFLLRRVDVRGRIRKMVRRGSPGIGEFAPALALFVGSALSAWRLWPFQWKAQNWASFIGFPRARNGGSLPGIYVPDVYIL